MSFYLFLCDAIVIFQMDAKYEIEKEQEARLWMEEVLGEPLDEVGLMDRPPCRRTANVAYAYQCLVEPGKIDHLTINDKT